MVLTSDWRDLKGICNVPEVEHVRVRVEWTATQNTEIHATPTNIHALTVVVDCLDRICNQRGCIWIVDPSEDDIDTIITVDGQSLISDFYVVDIRNIFC